MALALSHSTAADNAWIQYLADKVCASQSAAGTWYMYGSYDSTYLTALCTYTLCELKAQGFAVSEDVLKRAFAALDNFSRNASDSARALSFLTELKFNQASLSDLYYFAGQNEVKSVQAQAFLATCFAAIGDQEQKKSLLNSALDSYQHMAKLETKRANLPYNEDNRQERKRLDQELALLSNSPTSSLLHDGYLLLALEPALVSDPAGAELLDALSVLTKTDDYYTLPELSVMLLAASALQNNADMPTSAMQNIEHHGKPPYAISNNTKNTLFAKTSIFGLTATAPAPADHGFTLHKDYFDLQGKELALPVKLKQNERIIVRLSGILTTPASGTALLRDGIPSGFNVSTGAGIDNKLAQKLCSDGQTYSSQEQISESTYINAFELYPGSRICTLYLLRPGFTGSMAALPATLQLLRYGAVRSSTAGKAAAFSVQP